jgi:methyl-accepting chemotaxis protein
MAMTIGKKLNLSTLLFTLAALVPLGILAIMAISTARNSFVQERFSQLQSVRDIKKLQLEKLFADSERDLGVLVETVRTFRHEAFEKLTAVREVKRQAV